MCERKRKKERNSRIVDENWFRMGLLTGMTRSRRDVIWVWGVGSERKNIRSMSQAKEEKKVKKKKKL